MRVFVFVQRLLPSLLIAVSLVAQDAATTPSIPTPLVETMPDLGDHSAWAQDARFEGDRPDKSARGVYPVGNGRVFGYLGLGARANTMQGVSGPGYQTAEDCAPKGHFGEHTLELLVDGKQVDLPAQHVRRVRGANFVVTIDEDPKGLSLRTLSFAPPDDTKLVRVLDVVNNGAQEVRGARLVLRLEGRAALAAPADWCVDYDRGGRTCHAVFHLADQAADGVALPALAAGARWRGVLTIATAAGKSDAGARGDFGDAARQIDQATAAAQATLGWWRAKLRDTLYFDTDHRKLRDLVQDWKVLLLVQRDAGSGAVSPMVNYRGCWVRDSVGPLLLFLRFNMWQEAKDLLEYLYQATRLLDRVPNQVPLDLDFAGLEGKQVDWDKIAVPPSEVPSWIVLMHFWYWRVTRDHDLIRAHKKLLECCLRRQSRIDEVLLPFHGDETWMHGAFYSLYPDRIGENAQLVADDQWQGRRTFSFAAGVQYLLCIQAIGEMENGLAEADDPQGYAAKQPQDRPGQRYLTSSFKFMQELEKRYWMPEANMFAPALSPVTRQPHPLPYADVTLMPLWLGWTFPTGEKSRDNLKNGLARLWLRDFRIGETPNSGYACGHTQGKLVAALTERDAKDRLATVDALLRMAEPAGEWGELYDDRGRPVAAYDAQWPNRCRPWESGVNLDAILFALSGVRFVTVPNFDARDIRAKLRLPSGATYIGMRNVRKDGRDLNLSWRETHEKLTDKERADNAEKAADKRRDPEAVHRRLRFHIDLNSANPAQGYYDAGINAATTLFVRYLTREAPIDEVEFWTDDANEFLPTSPTPAPAVGSIKVGAGAKILYLTNRTFAGDLLRDDSSVALVDTGLPMTPADLAAALVTPEGKRRVDTLFLDWRARAPGRTTFKPETFWTDPVWQRAVGDFAADGGKTLTATFVMALATDRDGTVRADADGRLVLGVPAAGAASGAVTMNSDAAREVVLRVGSNTDLQVRVNDEEVLQHKGGRHALPDQDSVLVRLVPGANRVSFVLQGAREGILYARFTDTRGLPIEGLEPQ